LLAEYAIMNTSKIPSGSLKGKTEQLTMKSKLSPLGILAFVMVVNALSYGTIVPLMYPYAARFGINALGMSFLVTSFSIAQFFATPILGRLSDKYGRKPVLIFCLLGTAISLGVFALARSVAVLFISRIIDGASGGNISVAQAIISDSTKGTERAKAFGILGASFGFGFLVGPALGGLLSQYSLTAPFWFSAVLALLAVPLAHFFLPETLSPELKKNPSSEPLFKFQSIFEALFTPFTGIVLLVSFFAATALHAMFIGFQAFTTDVLRMSTLQIGITFSSLGLIGMFMQMVGIGPVLKRFTSKKKILIASLSLCAVSMGLSFLSNSILPFFASMMFFGVVSAFRDPMISALLSERTKAEDQGAIMGINQSYVSLGQIVGPLAAGFVAAYSVRYAFLVSAGFLILALIASRWLFLPKAEQKVLDI